MNLKFFGGVDTIGGNKVLLEDRNTKLFLDFDVNCGFGECSTLGFGFVNLAR